MDAPDFPYYNTVDQIYHAEWSTQKLARLELLAESIRALWPNGHPTRLIHVAGTGGKGSTCRFLEVGLGTVGRAGSFMSPHLFDYRERFSVGGRFVERRDVHEAWVKRIQPHCLRLSLRNRDQTHTFHEVSILLALALFDRHEVEWAAIETGVGGRYDQTRALDVLATALTNVGSDHAHILGSELWQRVLDKAGIARPGVPFFTSESNPESLRIIAEVCEDTGAPLHIVGAAEVHALEKRLAEQHPDPLPEESLLDAEYQRWNAALSLATIRSVYPQIDEAKALDAFVAARLPGRFWRVGERIYADIAHNADKMRALVSELRAHFTAHDIIVIVGLSGPRVPSDVFAGLARLVKTIIVTGASYKGQDPGKVRQAIEPLTGDTPVLVISDPRQALEIAKSMQGERDIILLTGSNYMIDQVLNPDPYLRHLSNTYGWRVQTDTEATGTVQLTLPKPPSIVR